jgi:hypothetical protein
VHPGVCSTVSSLRLWSSVFYPGTDRPTGSKIASAKNTARFIPPMLLLKRVRLPEGPEWL